MMFGHICSMTDPHTYNLILPMHHWAIMENHWSCTNL